MKPVALLLLSFLAFTACKQDKNKTKKTAKSSAVKDTVVIDEQTPMTTDMVKDITIHALNHATMALEYNGKTIYVDPVGGGEVFEGLPKPDLALITDIHGDHMDFKTLQTATTDDTQIIVPKAVANQAPENLKSKIKTLNNGKTIEINGISIEAIPMYNLREEALKFHEKGRGNGYVLTLGETRVYISGDTEDIPEMRALKDIDLALICMNLPYTMTVESAADAVLEFKPKVVYPYHYRGGKGLSDVEKFKTLVNKGNSNITVVQLDWYH